MDGFKWCKCLFKRFRTIMGLYLFYICLCMFLNAANIICLTLCQSSYINTINVLLTNWESYQAPQFAKTTLRFGRSMLCSILDIIIVTLTYGWVWFVDCYTDMEHLCKYLGFRTRVLILAHSKSIKIDEDEWSILQWKAYVCTLSIFCSSISIFVDNFLLDN